MSPPLSQSVEGICGRSGCRRPSYRRCEKKMCKQCCIAENGCSAPGHNFTRLSDRQKVKLQARPSVPSPSFHQTIPQPLSSSTTPPYTFELSLGPPSFDFPTNLGNTAAVNFPKTQTQHEQEESSRPSQLAAEHEEDRGSGRNRSISWVAVHHAQPWTHRFVLHLPFHTYHLDYTAARPARNSQANASCEDCRPNGLASPTI